MSDLFDRHRAFFGDQERDFALSADLVRELERLTGTGIGLIFKRLIRGDYNLDDILQTIRLAAIGGGASPPDAASLVQTYGARRPLSETLPLALAILECVFVGAPSTATEREDAE